MPHQPKQFSEKQTKAEILAAYNELVSQVQAQPRHPTPVSQSPLEPSDDPTKTITEARSRILADLHQATQAIEMLAEQRRQLEDEIQQKRDDINRLYQIKTGAQALQELKNQYREEQLRWEQERKERATRQEHEEKILQIKRQQVVKQAEASLKAELTKTFEQEKSFSPSRLRTSGIY